MHPPESDDQSERGMTMVSIPYFLYEAMARAYYGSHRNADLPVTTPVGGRSEPTDVSSAMYLDDEPPSNWVPGGFALKSKVQDARKTDTPD